MSIDHSTLAGNPAAGGDGTYPAAGYGGGIGNQAGQGALQVYDTIVAAKTADGGPDLNGSFTALGHHLVGNSVGGSGFAASDLLNVNAKLGPLQNNGGPTHWATRRN